MRQYPVWLVRVFDDDSRELYGFEGKRVEESVKLKDGSEMTPLS